MIVGVCGFIGSGKDTVADYLVNFHEFRRESFANTLKDAVAAVFGWDRTLLEGRTKEAREWREQVDTWWASRLNMPHLTPRWILQNWGTEVCRRGFHDDIWVASLENKLRKTTDNIVISDCRFPNEVSAIKGAGGIVIRVRRGAEPEWLKAAMDYMSGSQTLAGVIGKDILNSYGVHASEYSWVNTKFDHVLDNDGSIDELYKKIHNIVSNMS